MVTSQNSRRRLAGTTIRVPARSAECRGSRAIFGRPGKRENKRRNIPNPRPERNCLAQETALNAIRNEDAAINTIDSQSEIDNFSCAGNTIMGSFNDVHPSQYPKQLVLSSQVVGIHPCQLH